jgi:site-specific DNA-methyltransferase (adenine-specific)
VRIGKKLDPRTLRFGSKIHRDDAEGPELLRVAAVLSPTVLELNTGARVRLLGVAVPDENVVAAVEYLRDATQGTRVFMRYDEETHDSEGNLLCYLYLENKTFLNAHLIKRRLATVDGSRQFRFKERFVRYEQEVSVG